MRKIFGLALLLILAACGIDNTMYNAQSYFKSAQERPLNANGRPTPQAVDEYTKTIQKCGVILSNNNKGPRADDALFLMARALYYKGNSAFQAKDAFESLINGYPKSKHVPEAYLYLGRVLRDVNQVAESEALLERFVRDPKYIKHHPRALLILADYEIKDKDYVRAQFWLERIISNYRKTPEFKEAFFLFGKNYYMQNDFERSLQEFQKFQKTRGINKEMKLEAQYYIALNQYKLDDTSSAMKNIRNLIRNEVRPEYLSAARVLRARILLAEGNIEEGLAELEDVTKTYPRTEQSAAAYYHWGEYLYFKNGDIDAALPHLNKVRTEFAKSEFADLGQGIATALGQMKKPASLSSKSNLQDFLDYHYLKAEYFINPLALPDSSLASYQAVMDEYPILQAERDSLNLLSSNLQSQIDSLNALPELIQADSIEVMTEPAPELEDEMQIEGQPDEPDSSAVLDSLLIEPSDGEELAVAVAADSLFETVSDSLEVVAGTADSLSATLSDNLSVEQLSADSFSESAVDSLELDLPDQEAQTDTPELPRPEEPVSSMDDLDDETLMPLTDLLDEHATIRPAGRMSPDAVLLEEPMIEVMDSLSVAVSDSLADIPPVLSPVEQRNALRDQLEDLQSQSASLEESLQRFESDILPFCHFSIFSIYLDQPDQVEQSEQILAEMQSRFPRNIYTRAAVALKNGNIPRLVDPDLEAAEEAFDLALDHYPEHPDSLLIKMQEFTDSPYPELQLRANYRLGWYYTFEAPDTTLARDYLDAVQSMSDTAEYGTSVSRFYDGIKFLLQEPAWMDSLPEADSLNLSAPVDSLLDASASIDSLLMLPAPGDSLALVDSLAVNPEFADSLAMPELAIPSDSLQTEQPDSLDVPIQTDSDELPPNDEPEDKESDPPIPDAIPPLKEEDNLSE
ncbi:MAG: tetratricopeptide repeat protein [Candidatus Cloacimonetes bacterium]|jgi:TolA-binding protein|nr:tetratricopeptide repeat protein [Candidatus Cloacimonadota bacterium]MDY0336626.1 tetratricopeptide repeat protein [Candidatus Cloacimonadaceae bacterium]MCK9334355.1 tetratricopeptide repeat protein [Candidatus Cloacimonadota bacterium]MDD2683712.1 tetratricopeptide repeat protein [Candidatus Cloacimonadota bacterium]MDD3096444.1 tetratricopeptide repeat protein [Candidatus Cloacimonadota bacterium]